MERIIYITWHFSILEFFLVVERVLEFFLSLGLDSRLAMYHILFH